MGHLRIRGSFKIRHSQWGMVLPALGFEDHSDPETGLQHKQKSIFLALVVLWLMRVNRHLHNPHFSLPGTIVIDVTKSKHSVPQEQGWPCCHSLQEWYVGLGQRFYYVWFKERELESFAVRRNSRLILILGLWTWVTSLFSFLPLFTTSPIWALQLIL
jgi:hypothetical protein